MFGVLKLLKRFRKRLQKKKKDKQNDLCHHVILANVCDTDFDIFFISLACF
jgi:hypothetical protein